MARRQHGEPLERRSKYEFAAHLCRQRTISSVLDVGARDQVLKMHLDVGQAPAYTGVDINEASCAENVYGDLSKGLPFDDRSFDTVFALDVLEHLDDMDVGLTELVRVAERAVGFVLPNVAYFQTRLQFLRTGSLGGKYDVTPILGNDRHRWVTTFPHYLSFVEAFAERHGLRFEFHQLSAGPRRYKVERVLRAGGFSPSWYAHSTFFVLHRDRQIGI